MGQRIHRDPAGQWKSALCRQRRGCSRCRRNIGRRNLRLHTDWEPDRQPRLRRIDLATRRDGADHGWHNSRWRWPDRSELYLPASASFAPASNMTAGRELHTATLLGDGTVLIAGGFNGPFPTASAEIYRPAVLVAAPLLFSLSGDGHGQGAIWHAATGGCCGVARRCR